MPQMWRLLMRVEKRIMVTITWSLIFNGSRAHTKKHSALERCSSLPSVFSSTFERSLFHDPLDTLALKGAELRDSWTTCARVETSKARVPRYEPQRRAYLDTNELSRGRTNTRWASNRKLKNELRRARMSSSTNYYAGGTNTLLHRPPLA